MTEVDRAVENDLETPIHVLRLGIEVVETDEAAATVTMSMSLAGMCNPFTDLPTVGPLAVLIDGASGLANHFLREADEWTVSSELTLDLSPTGSERATAPGAPPVLAVGQVLGPRGRTSLSLCTLTCGDTVIGGGSVRSFFITPDDVTLSEPEETLTKTARTTLAELMAVQTTAASEGLCVLRQHPDSYLDNAIGVVNGGVAAAGLELAASAVVNTALPPMRTASVRVNFLRPFFAGQRSRYEASPVRIGGASAVADAKAINDDGRAALTARITAYR
ncbi:MAG: PaaI family thioesterase [Mycobacterium sp.]